MDEDSGAVAVEAAKKPGIVRRIIAFPITLWVISTVLIVLAAYGGQILVTTFDIPGRGFLEFVAGALIGVIVIAVYKLYKRWIEREPDAEFAFDGFLPELGAGLGIGFGLFCLMASIVWLLGGLTITGVRGSESLNGFWSWAGLGIFSGVVEEVLFRGLMLRLFEKLTGTWIALGLTSALFGFLHMINPNSSFLAGLAITVEAGILLGACYLLTRRLWLAVGVHAAWNFTQGWVFSLPVSGMNPVIGLLATERQGSDWLTGGDFGLEASLAAMVVATAAGIAMLVRAIAKGRIMRPIWSRPKPD